VEDKRLIYATPFILIKGLEITNTVNVSVVFCGPARSNAIGLYLPRSVQGSSFVAAYIRYVYLPILINKSIAFYNQNNKTADAHYRSISVRRK
jgi:uncharacterized oligopeptide transporter (OPT) family protein